MSETAKFDITEVQSIATRVIKDPAAFYRDMPREGGYKQPLLFIAVIAIFTGLLFAMLSMIGGPYLGVATGGILSVLLLPVGMIIACFIASAILFVIWKLMGSTQRYETAFRCQAFAGSIVPITALLSLIPYLGSVAAVAWGSLLLIHASIEVHGIDRQKSMIVFCILGLLLIYSNVSNERMMRNMSEQAAQIQTNTEEAMPNMSPEETGRALGEFLKGIEEGRKQD